MEGKPVIMKASEYNTLLRKNNIGGIFGGNKIFDDPLSVVPHEDLSRAEDWADEELSWWTYSTRADCNKFHVMKYGRMNEWILQNPNLPHPPTFSLVYGKFEKRLHMWIAGCSDIRFFTLNYHDIVVPASYHGDGSFTP